MSSQPQLLPIALDPQDVVYTPLWCAQDMVEFFNPVGSILEPCAGDGVFLKFLPSAYWCEIEKGVDFFAWDTHVNWMIGNPPYRMSGKFIRHSMKYADNFVYLLPCDKPFISYGMMKDVSTWGGLVHMRVYGTGSKLGFPIGYAVGAIHFQKGYQGAMSMSFYDALISNKGLHTDSGYAPAKKAKSKKKDGSV